jgi:hypothetical protein
MAFESRNQFFLECLGGGAWALNLISFLTCGTLFSAQVDYVVGKASAPAEAQLDVGDRFATGVKSSSQVSLDRGFFRMGAEAGVQVVSSNGLALEKGVMLVGANPERRRKAVEVLAPGYKMEIRGTALVAYYPGQYVKITVLEGKMKVALQSLLGEFESVEAGQMLIINPADKRLPEPVEVDLNRLVTTSQLLGGPLGAPSTQELINNSVSDQGEQFSAGQIARTPYLLRGASPEVNLALPNRSAALTSGGLARDEVTVFRLVNDIEDPTAKVASDNWLGPDGNQFNHATMGDVTIKRRTAQVETLNVNMQGSTASGPEIYGRVRASSDVFDGKKKQLVFQTGMDSGTVEGNTLKVRSGSDVQSPSDVALRFRGLGFDVDGARLQAGKASQPSEELELTSTLHGLNIRNSELRGAKTKLLLTTGPEDSSEQTLQIDNAKVEANNDIQVAATLKSASIILRNSTELSALVGSITVQSKGGPILVDASKLTARSQIVIDALDSEQAARDSSVGGLVHLRGATMVADVIRARGYTASNDALIIEGGRFEAASLLKFYAESASTLRFRGQVDIKTPLAIFSGHAVEVEAGGSVRVQNGQARVYVSPGNDRFNRPGFGSMSANEVSVQPYNQRPRF